MTRTTAGIVALARELGVPLPEGTYKLHRTYAGYWQRSEGAWSWWLGGPASDHSADIYRCRLGSQWPATEVLKAHKDPNRRVVLDGDALYIELLPEEEE